MRITIITGPFLPLPPYAFGAIEKRWFQVGCYMREALGQKVVFVSKCVDGQVDDSANVFIKGYKRTGSSLKDAILDLIYTLKALRKAPNSDVVVLNTVWSPILISFFKRKFGLTVYNVARYPKRQMKYYGGVDVLSCVSLAAKNAVVALSQKLGLKAVVVNNPINTQVFTSDSGRTMPIDKVKVVYAGRIHREKGLEILVKAINIVAKTRDVELTLIGPWETGDGGSGETYVAELNALADECRIQWKEAICDVNELANELKKHDIFCYPSVAERGETFGVAPLEAMGLGLVTIVSSLDCFKDFAVHGENAYVFNHRSENPEVELSSLIEGVSSDPVAFERVSSAAIRQSKQFSVAKIAEDYMKLFDRFIAKRRTK